jgi:hypothetical protein
MTTRLSWKATTSGACGLAAIGWPAGRRVRVSVTLGRNRVKTAVLSDTVWIQLRCRPRKLALCTVEPTVREPRLRIEIATPGASLITSTPEIAPMNMKTSQALPMTASGVTRP